MIADLLTKAVARSIFHELLAMFDRYATDGAVCVRDQALRLRGKGDDSDVDDVPVRRVGYKRTRPESPLHLVGYRARPFFPLASWRRSMRQPVYRAVLAVPVSAPVPQPEPGATCDNASGSLGCSSV